MVVVVYSSHTGSCKRYAEALAARGGLECIPVKQAKDVQDQIVFFGWVRGKQVVGLNRIDPVKLKCVCVVGLDDRFDRAGIVSFNKTKTTVYYLRGWIDRSKLNIFDKLIIDFFAAMMKLRGLNQFNQPIFDAMMENGSFYDESKLDDIASFLRI